MMGENLSINRLIDKNIQHMYRIKEINGTNSSKGNRFQIVRNNKP